MADLRISDLVTASQLKNDDYYEISQSESGTRVSYKTTLLAIAVQIATMVDFTSDLNTTSKKITGAINELKQLISLIPQFSIEVVQTLPTEDISDTTIYLVPAEDPEVGNYYEEYIHVNDSWELVGTTAVDLSAYYTKLEVDGLLADKLEADDFEANQTASVNPITLETKQAGLAKSCAVEMNPIQDLHGYSNPWPAGGGKNKYGGSDISNTSSGSAYTSYSINLSAGTWTISAQVTSDSGDTAVGVSFRDNDGQIIKGYIDVSSSRKSATVTLDRACTTLFFYSGYSNSTKANTTYKDIQIESGSPATDYAPYSNICPISGRTETNILQGTNSTNMYKDTGVTPFNSNTTGVEFHGDNSLRVYAKTSNSYQTSKQLLSNYSTLENGKKYAIFADVEIKSGIGMIAIRNSANAVISEPVTRITTSGTYMCTFIMSSEANFLSFFCTWDTPNINADVKYTNIRFVEYEKLITKEFGQTVYGGSLDFVNGGLDNEYELFEPTIVTTVAQSSGLWYWAFSLPKTSTNPLSTNGLMSSHFNPTNQVLAIGNCYITANGTLLLCVPADQTLNTGALVNAWLAENDLQFAYKPATKTTIQLSPEAVKLLKGLNVISTDGDKVQVEFSDIPVGDYSTLLDYVKSLEARIQALEG